MFKDHNLILPNYKRLVCRINESPHDIDTSELPVLTIEEYSDKFKAGDKLPVRFIVNYGIKSRSIFVKNY